MVYRRHALSQQIWITFQRFWMLVNNNKATLKRLRLDVTVGQAVSLEPLYKILASCSNLIYLENNYQPMDFQRLLECLPKLKSFTSNFSFLNRALLTKDMPQLRKLTLRHLVPTLSLIAMIKHLVNLEQLYIGWKITHFEESEPILGKTKSRIRGLHFLKHSFKDGDLFLVYSILPWMPELRELTVSHLAMHTAFAIATYCPLFESFTQVVLSSSLHPNYCMKTDPNSVAILLQNCRHLKHINAIQHAITAEHLDSAPEWVCNSSLKTFRVQIRGITRLLTSEEMVDSQAAYVNSLIDRPNTPAQEHALQVLNKSRDQHHRIYSRLSHLTALTVLDLGMEFRHIDVYRSKNPPYYKVGAKRYIDYGDPFPDTLELSLKSGLSQLETLKNLEVFGFEGCDHRMEREEMEWMVKAWPRLREIRGLQKVKMHALQRDIPTERLARHMARLKPSVKQ
ncbi:hypothetical protein FBU30_001864 [Linnemannia zychae]|nr:hypothetical protein FBU30_001864 [Linnemannia zychae]